MASKLQCTIERINKDHTYFNILEHTSKSIYIVGWHTNLTQPFNDIFFLLAVDTGAQNKSVMRHWNTYM